MKYVHGQIITFSLRALWQMFASVNGVAEMRDVRIGDRQLTKEELRKDAMDIAKKHIEFVQECVELLPTK